MTGRKQVHAAVREMCATLFREPARLREILSHRVAGTFAIATHRHPNELQLDVLDGCRGEVLLGDRTHAVSGLTLLVHYPGVRHGFRLRGGTRWHVKLRLARVPTIWPEIWASAPAMPRLRRTVRDLSSYTVQQDDWPPRLLALVAELLSIWPLNDVSALDAAGVEDDRDLAEAVALVQASDGRPPSVAAMAAAAHLSPRHFARRFRARLGCTPADFADRHRLAHAKALLLGGQLAAADVADAVGFTTHSAFTRWFTAHVGQTPRRFRDDPQTA
ncbi:MAG: AraC family transcriptional regulator [Planctomycetota bacterium]